MSISKEATEAAAREIYGGDWEDYESVMRDALTAALPFLARPAPNQSDEDVWLKHVDMAYHGDINDPDTVLITRSEFHTYLAAIRAEATLAADEAWKLRAGICYSGADIAAATLAGAAAEREALEAEVLEAFDLGYAWRGTLVGQTLEDSRAVGRTLCGDLFDGLSINANAVPSFATADTGIVAAKAEIKRALAAAIRARK